MTDLIERLRTTPTERTWDSVGRPYDYPKHLPLEAADRIESLERENAELRAAVGKLRKLATHSSNCGHRFGHDCDCDLSTIRASTYANRSSGGFAGHSSPTPLQEQNANSGKEVG